MMKCKKCGHEGDPITTVEPFPAGSVQVDQEDRDHDEHQYGLDVDGNVQIGLEVCRNCKAIAGFWIEDAGDADFYVDWGKDRAARQRLDSVKLKIQPDPKGLKGREIEGIKSAKAVAKRLKAITKPKKP